MKTLTLKRLFVPSLAFSGLVASVMFAAKPAQAATFNVNGIDYDITTVTGYYYSLIDQLQATPWWGNDNLANTFSTTVGNFFGNSNDGSGVYFAHALSSESFVIGFYYDENYNSFPLFDTREVVDVYGTQLNLKIYDDGRTKEYAVAVTPAAVPEPLTILGSITAAGFGVAFKRKKNSTKEE